MIKRNCILAIGLALSSIIVHAETDDGYALSTAIWDDSNINVCWENTSHSSALQRSWITTAIQNTWEKESDVNFIGWGQCNASSDGIRIQVNDSGPHTKGLGNQLDGTINGMVLNFTYANWSPSCQSNI
ncbi:hypothetical protein [Marinicellulosiphila megalodicopiae]|uniref:hypothetical protein n=1 Tax=Marinicellulosiphila megalodicopiae TaxID=2724896 RepID=UPI003BAF2C46